MTRPPFSCAGCAFFSANLATDGRNGQCRRRAPHFVIAADGARLTMWPLVRADAWCGDHATVEDAPP